MPRDERMETFVTIVVTFVFARAFNRCRAMSGWKQIFRYRVGITANEGLQ